MLFLLIFKEFNQSYFSGENPGERSPHSTGVYIDIIIDAEGQIWNSETERRRFMIFKKRLIKSSDCLRILKQGWRNAPFFFPGGVTGTDGRGTR